MKICVFGAASPKIDADYVMAVENLGERLAKRGHELVFGAGGNGLMGAVARGVKRVGGKITGIIPEFFKDDVVEAIFDQCDDLIYTKSMRDRKMMMEDMADAFIIVPGGIGTFEEFFEVLTLKQLARHSKPIAIYAYRGYYDEMMHAMEKAVEKGFVNDVCLELYEYLDDIDLILNYIEEHPDCTLNVNELKEG